MNSEVKTRVKTEGVKRIKNEVVDIGSDVPNKKIKISNSISSDSIKCLMNSCEEKREFSNMNPFLDHCVRFHFFDQLKSDLKNTARHELECPLCPEDKNTFQKLKSLIWHYGVHHEMVLKYAKFQTISTETKKECKRKQQKQRLRKLIKEFQNEIIVLKEDCAKSELEKEKLLKKNEENEAKISKQNIELERNCAKYELEKEKLLKQNLEYEAKISKLNIELEKYSLKHKNYAKSELEKEKLMKQNQECEANLNEVIKDLKNDCAKFKTEMNNSKIQEQKLELECRCYRSEIKEIQQKYENEALKIAKLRKKVKKVKAKLKHQCEKEFLLDQKNDILEKLIKDFQTEILELKENSAKSELQKEKLLKQNEEYEVKISKQNIELNSNQEDHSFEFEAIDGSTNDQKMIIKEEFQTEISELKEACAKSELEKEKLLKNNQEYEAKLSKQRTELENYSSTRKKFICKKCCTDLESGYMLDCGHLPFCNSCSMSITIEESPKCPICKKSVAYRLPALIEELI